MKVLYIKTGTQKTADLQKLMTDKMWREVVIKYSNQDTYLLLEDQKILLDISDIIKVIDPRYRTFFKKIIRFLYAISKICKVIIKGQRLFVDKKIQKERRDTCIKCTLKRGRFFRTCSICGCNIRLKTKMTTESCPIEKW